MPECLFHFDNSYEKLPHVFYRKVPLHPVPAPAFVCLNEKLAADLGLDPERLRREALEVFAGNVFPPEAAQLSQAYLGHQFGYLNMLGDGRAVLIGEQITPDGRRFDLQLKGSGPTPFSRGGDGRATLRYMLKEYLFSEAMHHLGVATSRSLAVVKSGENVQRESPNEGAVLTRVMSSHLRVGTFQYAAMLDDPEALKSLADYAIERHYPELLQEEKKYLKFFECVMERQIETVAKWMSLGFVHGVMNTDNVSISGESFDYGPCAFIDNYDPDAVFSSIDSGGRYRFGSQPAILLWNLARFAEALLPLFDPSPERAADEVMAVLNRFGTRYEEIYYGLMSRKLGFFSASPSTRALLDRLLAYMQQKPADFTDTFAALRRGDFAKFAEGDETGQKWLSDWQEGLRRQGRAKAEVRALLEASDPLLCVRNYWTQAALDAAVKGDLSLFEAFLQELRRPYEDNPEKAQFLERPAYFPYVTYCGT